MYRVKSLKNLKKKIYPRDVRYRGDCTVKHVIIYILYKEKERRKILSFPFSLSFCLQCSLINVIDPVVSSF